MRTRLPHTLRVAASREAVEEVFQQMMNTVRKATTELLTSETWLEAADNYDSFGEGA